MNDEDKAYRNECVVELIAWDYAFVAHVSYDETFELLTSKPYLVNDVLMYPATQYVQKQIKRLDFQHGR